jgi:hypothetical protein
MGVEERAWVRGFGTALAEIYRSLVLGFARDEICRIVKEAGLSLSDFKEAGLSEYDLGALLRADVREERS